MRGIVLGLMLALALQEALAQSSPGKVELNLINAGATSIWSSSYDAGKGFVEDSYWHPEAGSSLPQTIYNHFPSRVQVTKFQLIPTKNKADHFPTNFIFFGSNADDCKDEEKWELQVPYKDPVYDDDDTFQAEVKNRNMFRCYGFKINSNEDGGPYTAIKWIRMYRSETIDACASGPCKNSGRCYRRENKFICKCAPGWNGVTCEKNINECDSAPCKNNGACTDGVNQFTCNCAPGWNGETCEENINECDSAPCKNNGACTDGVNQFTCNCAPGWNGETCEENINKCAGGPCKNNGTCTDGVNQFTCKCAPGWSGETCETEPTLDPCDVSVRPRSNITFELGIAGASSIYHAPNRAVNGFSPLEKEKWWASDQTKLPAFIWYDFVKQSFSPAKVAFYPADYGYGSKQMPQDFQFIGSNDDVCNTGSTWTVLCENRYPKNSVKEDETRGCEVDFGSGKPFSDFKFRCLGIKVLRVNRGRSTNVVALRGIQMWKLEC